jgi:Zeta toxin
MPPQDDDTDLPRAGQRPNHGGSERKAGMQRCVDILLDATRDMPDRAIRKIREWQDTDYDVEIRVVATHRLDSEAGIDARFADKIDEIGDGRDVPLRVHDRICRDLPDNLDKAHLPRSKLFSMKRSTRKDIAQ